MLCPEDCLAFSGLTPDQLDAVACFKHLPVIVAAEWAASTLQEPDGWREVEEVILAEVAIARCHRRGCAETWNRALEDFRRDHRPPPAMDEKRSKGSAGPLSGRILMPTL